jgi:hypothetical protein
VEILTKKFWPFAMEKAHGSVKSATLANDESGSVGLRWKKVRIGKTSVSRDRG